MAYLHESLPPAPQARDARVLGGAEEKKVMARASQCGPVRVAVARGRSHRPPRVRRVLTDERAASVGNVQHRARHHHGRRLCWRRRSGHDTGPRRLDSTVCQLMQAVGHHEHVPVGGEALGREAFQQAGAAAAAQLERELPAQVVAVVNARVQALTAEWAGQVPGIAKQEAPSIGELGDQSTVHPERGRPGDLLHTDPLCDPSLDHRGYRASRRVTRQPLGLALVDVSHEGEPVSAGQGYDQDPAFWAGDQCRTVSRQAACHDPAGNHRGARVGRTRQGLGHRFPRHAVRAAGTNNPACLDGVSSPVRPL